MKKPMGIYTYCMDCRAKTENFETHLCPDCETRRKVKMLEKRIEELEAKK